MMNNNWQTMEFDNETLLLTIDGASSSWKVPSGDWPATCTEKGVFVSCNDDVGGVNKVVLARDSGRAAFIDVYGGLMPPENERGMMVGSYNCTIIAKQLEQHDRLVDVTHAHLGCYEVM